MNLIDKDKLLFLFEEDKAGTVNEAASQYDAGVWDTFEKAMEIIKNMPVIEERKHGHWIEDEFTEDDDEWLSRWRCSVCNCSMGTLKGEYPTWKSCPNCTAIMDEKERNGLVGIADEREVEIMNKKSEAGLIIGEVKENRPLKKYIVVETLYWQVGAGDIKEAKEKFAYGAGKLCSKDCDVRAQIGRETEKFLLVSERFKIGDVVKYVGSNYKLLKKTGVVVCLIGSNKVRILFEDEEKALDIEADDLILKSYLNKLSENYPQTFDEAINELSTGIQVALKNESEPMQVLNEKYDKGDIDYSGNCPKCGNYLIREYNKKYCGTCGQNLRWGEHNLC